MYLFAEMIKPLWNSLEAVQIIDAIASNDTVSVTYILIYHVMHQMIASDEDNMNFDLLIGI